MKTKKTMTKKHLLPGDYYYRVADIGDGSDEHEVYGVVLGRCGDEDVPASHAANYVSVHEWSDAVGVDSDGRHPVGCYDRIISREEYELMVPEDYRGDLDARI